MDSFINDLVELRTRALAADDYWLVKSLSQLIARAKARQDNLAAKRAKRKAGK